MLKMLSVVKRFAAHEEGASLIEYTVLIGILLVAVITTILAVGSWVNNQWTTLNTTIGAH
ncbi:MAG TPA: Flp family type IVb pilin [Xanthobacteraceae bacterium]|nr:Flp family type IVb pilin [Xanthobacteraceae bacterium]